MNLQDKIEHVFVLMLENHSFDNIFGNSGIPGIAIANSKNYNSYDKKPYYFQGNARPHMPTDPGHEFLDVVEQLCGKEASENYKGGKYPPIKPINQKGFVTNYATSTSEGTGVPCPDEIKDIMKGFDTETQLPVTYQLATEFGICDHWYSSLPGPTWPNRFFVHGGSSAGLDHSPSPKQIGIWELDPLSKGFLYENGSLYDRLSDKGIDWNLYQDKSLSAGGQIPQVASIKGIQQWEVYPLTLLYTKLALAKHFGYKPKYTFIEPNYGNVSKTYKDGSSQHPMDGMARGEQLIKNVYEAIRNSSIWEKSLLIITYDEHGGFYDHATPPPAIPPGDQTMIKGSNQYGFEFDQYGVRVPAIIVSPYIKKGSVSHKPYDHTTVIRTLHEVHNIGHLTHRDEHANHVGELLSLDQARTDCPTHLNDPVFPDVDSNMPGPDAEELLDSGILPDEGNFIGFLFILLKSKLGLADGDKEAMIEEFKNMKTRGEARAFMEHVKGLVEAKQTEAITEEDSDTQNLFYLDKALMEMGKSFNQDLFFSIVNHLGPAVYNQDAAHVACSESSELNTVKKNFLINKLGMENSPQLEEMIQDVCQKMGKSNRRKNRAIFYYLLTVMLEKESVFA